MTPAKRGIRLIIVFLYRANATARGTERMEISNNARLRSRGDVNLCPSMLGNITNLITRGLLIFFEYIAYI